jgi:hypothetical protein
MATNLYELAGAATWTSGGVSRSIHNQGFTLLYRGRTLSMGEDGKPWRDFHGILDQEAEGVLQVTDLEALCTALLPGEAGVLSLEASRIGEDSGVELVMSGALIVPGGKLEIPHGGSAEAEVRLSFVSVDGLTSPVSWSVG